MKIFSISLMAIVLATSLTAQTIDQDAPTLAAIITSDGSGNVAVAPNLPSGFCGLTLQAVDVFTCAVSNTIVL